ncbi:MAG: TnpV protein, partial [Clostridia bacterium]
LNNLDKYGEMRLRYLHAKKPELYRELFFTGKLAEHCEQIEAVAFKMSEQIQEDYIAKHPLPEDDFWMRVSIRMMAQMVADEVICHEIICI